MRVVLPLIALFLSTGAVVPPTAEAPPAALPAPEAAIRVLGSTEVCRDRIHEVRRELGQPELRRDASPEEPLMISAVDMRVGACSVLVMHNQAGDFRPLPEPREHQLMPAK